MIVEIDTHKINYIKLKKKNIYILQGCRLRLFLYFVKAEQGS